MFKGIIFDFDGVIADTEVKKFKDLKNALQSYNYHLEEDIFSNLIGKKTNQFLTKKFPNMPKNIMEDINKKRKDLQFSNIQDYKLVPGILELLTFLKSKKYIIAVTTGSERNFVEKILVNHSISNYFDIIITGEDFISSKPDPECYRITLKKLKLSPSEVIVIEDSIHGVKAAKSLGCTVFALKTYLKENDLFEADKIFKNHFNVLKYLKSKI